MHPGILPIVLVVFAGGPHTASRATVAEHEAERLQPDCVFLTGAEFAAEARPVQDRLRHQAASRHPSPLVLVDTSRSTVASCLSLRAFLETQYPQGASVMVVTSDYHAPRLGWLLHPLLPGRYALSLRTSPDIPLRQAFSSPLHRHLIGGEFVSWLYGLPLGLLFRPALMAALVLGLLGAAWTGRHRPQRPRTP